MWWIGSVLTGGPVEGQCIKDARLGREENLALFRNGLRPRAVDCLAWRASRPRQAVNQVLRLQNCHPRGDMDGRGDRIVGVADVDGVDVAVVGRATGLRYVPSPWSPHDDHWPHAAGAGPCAGAAPSSSAPTPVKAARRRALAQGDLDAPILRAVRPEHKSVP